MFAEIFLLTLALIWILFATIQDIKIREVANWLNFSLIIFALGFRFFYSFFAQTNFAFFYQGLIGFALFFLFGNIFYYSRLFAGGDAKLFMALGAILPLSSNLNENLMLFLNFFLIFLFVGAIYGLIWSTVLFLKNRKIFRKKFNFLFNKNRKMVYLGMFIGLVVMVSGFFQSLLLFLGVFIFILPFLFLYAKAIDESCMIRKVKTTALREGDWLCKDVKIGKNLIKAKWEGLTKKQIIFLKKKKKFVLIKQGIPFVPVFLLTFILFILFYYLRYSFW